MIDHRTLANLAAEAYDYAMFNLHECEVIISTVENVQVIAFRGTEIGRLLSGSGWLDVIRDLHLLPWYDPDTGWVHAGFLKGGRRAAEFLSTELEASSPVICTGHSLGGALALTCAVKLMALGFHVLEWVGFGSPKVQLTEKKYPFRQTNYQHGSDLVPHLPDLPFYRHNCEIVHLCRDRTRLNLGDHDVSYYRKYVP